MKRLSCEVEHRRLFGRRDLGADFARPDGRHLQHRDRQADPRRARHLARDPVVDLLKRSPMLRHLGRSTPAAKFRARPMIASTSPPAILMGVVLVFCASYHIARGALGRAFIGT